MKFCAVFFAAFLLARACVAQQPAAPQTTQKGVNANSSDKLTPNPRKKLLDEDLKGFDLAENKTGKVKTVVGGTRGVESPSKLLGPHLAKLYGCSALFQWSAKSHDEGFIFIIVDEEDTRIVGAEVKETGYLLPAGESRLSPGETYQWRVRVLPNTIVGEGLKFTVVSDEEQKQIEKEFATIPAGSEYETGLSRARVLVAHHLWFDVIGAYADLIAKFPDSAQLYEDRGAVYSQIEITRDLAKLDQTRAAALAAR